MVLIRNSQKLFKISLRKLKIIVEDLLEQAGLSGRDLNILLADNREITVVNREYFGRDRPTNVISFSYLDGYSSEVVGDIIISVERASEEATAAGITLHERLVVLIIHGFVHILGYDHEEDKCERRRMRYREKKLYQSVSDTKTFKDLLRIEY